MRPVSAEGPSAWPGPARVFDKRGVARLPISVVPSRDGQRAERCPDRRRCTGMISSCTSRRTVYAVGTGGVVKAHPKWQTSTTNENKKARNLAVSGPLHKRALEGVRLCATSTRWHLILCFSNTQAACGLSRIRVALVLIQSDRRHAIETNAHPDAHERSARGGSNAGEVQCGVHDGSWVKICRCRLLRFVKRDGSEPRMKTTVNSVYGGVNNRDNLFLSCCCF